MLILKNQPTNKKNNIKVTRQWVLSLAAALCRASPSEFPRLSPWCYPCGPHPPGGLAGVPGGSRTSHGSSAPRKPAPGALGASHPHCWVALLTSTPLPHASPYSRGRPPCSAQTARRGNKQLPDISPHVCVPLGADGSSESGNHTDSIMSIKFFL